jgi:transposase-like protein
MLMDIFYTEKESVYEESIMDKETFDHLQIELEALTASQRDTVLSRLQTMLSRDNNQRVIEESVGVHAHCPYCADEHIVKFGHTQGQQRYRCQACRRTFIALTGTPFVRLRNKEKLLEQAACMAEGLTIRKTAERVGLSADRAFRWRHFFLVF